MTPIYPSFKLISCPRSKDLAFTPRSMISILVNTAIVRRPLGSAYLASCKPSEVDISAFAGITVRMIVLGSSIYLLAISLVIFSIFSFCPLMGIRVMPGKSIRVRSGQLDENIVKRIGLSTISWSLEKNSYLFFSTNLVSQFLDGGFYLLEIVKFFILNFGKNGVRFV